MFRKKKKNTINYEYPNWVFTRSNWDRSRKGQLPFLYLRKEMKKKEKVKIFINFDNN